MNPGSTTPSVLRDLGIVVAGFFGLGVVVAILMELEDARKTPLWLSFTIFGGAVVAFLYLIFRPDLKRLRQWRRRGRGRCAECGYDLRGLVVNACPECGRLR